jgi:uncharacterized protein DUF4288
MSWYGATLVLECVIGGQAQQEPELQVRLVEATSHEEAYRLAQELGTKAEHAYRNHAGEEVSWHFRGLHELNELSQDPKHGAEVHSWRSRQSPRQLVRPPEQLSAFWAAANKHRTARQILQDS